jgi:hypothetical protein
MGHQTRMAACQQTQHQSRTAKNQK